MNDLWKRGIASYSSIVSQGRNAWFPYDWSVHLAQTILPLLLAGNARVIVNAPPRHGKSELISHWLPCWYLDNWPNKRVMLCTYGSDFATDWGRKARDEATMNDLVSIDLKADSKAASAWATQQGGGMMTAGVGGPITGRGADLGVIDDPHKDWAEALSATRRETVTDWFSGTFYTRLEPGGSIVIIQTRWHESDLTGYLLEEHEDNWTLLSYPALSEGEGDILGRPKGAPLCPERYSADDLERFRKAIGSHKFAGLYQQRPYPLQGGIIKNEWFRYYVVPPKFFTTIIQSWDCAFKDTDTSDYVVGQVWGLNGADKYLLDQVRGRMSFTETCNAIKMMSTKWPKATRKLIEDKANGTAVIDALKRKISGMKPINPEGGKLVRVHAVEPQWESGNVWVPHPEQAPWIKQFREEVTGFPSLAHDDQVDAMSQALTYLEGKSIGRLKAAMENVKRRAS